MNQASKRYAEALFKSAAESKEIEKIRQELYVFKKLFNQHAILEKILYTPLLSKKEVADALLELAKRIGFSALFTNFLQVLALQKRLPLLQDITASFEEIFDRSQGILKAYITSAHKMNEEQKKLLITLLEQKLSSKIILHENINTNLLGGYIIQIGPYLFDNTLSYKLNKLYQSLKRIA
ncbi:MAG: F0F1 ATP synthase subunit delta [Candidatus Paracaedimonas acanthamoebae]|uniref:ATP synthase subunit delta n=1 Tax=Candidatus Paracaedimonas acanthamoebae TaxID=244581 RepID=A0A8J7Q077_9PROT|nr:F0F1 ATP synthase subunit delta [Candidatus Paracaedimonas acanthamoebae]